MRISRHTITPEALASWPTATTATLSQENALIFKQREAALELFAQGESIRVIEDTTGVGRKQIYNLVRRAQVMHSDGRIFGFRALLPNMRVKQLERTAPVRHLPLSQGGDAGAMSQLLARYPELVTFLRMEISRNPKLFGEAHFGTVRVLGLDVIHKRFVDRCRALGLRESDYPLVKKHLGIRSLSAVLKRLKSETFRQSAKAAGATHSKGPWRDDDNDIVAGPVTRPFEAVEFDGHKLDLRVSVTFPDPFGFDQTLELTRVWILVIVDVMTRAVLGYQLVLAPEYKRYDVIRAIQKAIEPQPQFKFTLPGLGYGDRGGFPSQLLPELGYAIWEEFRFDNAKANLAADTLAVLGEQLACLAHAGPARDPDKRPIIERFFLTLTKTMSQRLPASTASNPDELRRQMNAAGTKSLATMPLSHLEELIEAVVASLNGTPHSSLGGRSPLQAMEYFIRGQRSPYRVLPAPMRRNLALLQMAHNSRVAGNVSKGVRPSINFFGVRYSSAAFTERVDLIGRRVLVYYNPDNICTIRVFTVDGSEIGILRASRPWDRTPHSLRVRQHIHQLTRQAKLRVPASANPVEVYLDYIQKHAPKSRRKASELEVARRTVVAPTAETARTAGPNYATDVSAGATPLAAPAEKRKASKPAKPQEMSIPSGFNY